MYKIRGVILVLVMLFLTLFVMAQNDSLLPVFNNSEVVNDSVLQIPINDSIFEDNLTEIILPENTLGVNQSVIDEINKTHIDELDDFLADPLVESFSNQNEIVVMQDVGLLSFDDSFCGGGSLATTCYLNSTYTYTNGETISGNELVIQSNGKIQNTANMQSVLLNFENIMIESGGLIYGGNVSIFANNLTVDSESTISSDGLGFPIRQGPGYVNNAVGSSHGGLGGGALISKIYGSSLEPRTFGSGGHSTSDGGGIVYINSDYLNLNGEITSSGEAETSWSASSGGSIYVLTHSLHGSGKFAAKGGNRLSTTHNAGGGGRIAVYYNESTFTGIAQSSVAGGYTSNNNSAYIGEAGTMIFVDVNDNSAIIKDGFKFYGMIGIANETKSSNKTFWNSNNPDYWNFTNLTIHNNSIFYTRNINLTLTVNQAVNNFQAGDEASFYSLTFISTLDDFTLNFPFDNINFHDSLLYGWGNLRYFAFANISYLDLFNTTLRAGNISLELRNLTLDSESTISSDGLGFPVRQGPGYVSNAVGSSHGGLGGGALISKTYGSSLEPRTFGSGGYSTSDGGGIVYINSDYLNLNGEITSSGEAETLWSASSGGSIYVLTHSLHGSGKFAAKGGNRLSTTHNAGGGGRIAVYYNESTFTGIAQSSVAGGYTSNNNSAYIGEAGTFIYTEMDLPNITFTFPTPNPGEGVTDGAIFNVSIKNSDLSSIFYSWEGINYSILDPSTKVFFDFENISNEFRYVKDRSFYVNSENYFHRENTGYFNREYVVIDEFNYIVEWSPITPTGDTTGAFITEGRVVIQTNNGVSPRFQRSVSFDGSEYSSIEIKYRSNLDKNNVPFKIQSNNIASPGVSIGNLINDSKWYTLVYNLTGLGSVTNLILVLADDSGISGSVELDYIKFFKDTGNSEPNYISGQAGTALAFDGNSYLKVPYISDRKLMPPQRAYTDIDLDGNSFTISAWVKRNSGSPGNFLSRYNESNNARIWRLSLTNDTIESYVDNDGSNYNSAYLLRTTGLNITDDEWHHIVLTKNNGLCILYLNSVELNQTASCPTTVDTSKNQPLLIGAFGNGSALEYFNGSIDSVYIFEKYSTASDVSVLYRSKLKYEGNRTWNLEINQSDLEFGDSYIYEFLVADKFSEYTSSGTRIIQGNSAPTFSSIISTPSVDNLNDLDPNREITIYANISDTDNNLAGAYLQWKNSTQNWSEIISQQNISMNIVGPISSVYFANASFILPVYEDNVTYRIHAIDSLDSDRFSSEIVLNTFWDCSWDVEPNLVQYGYGYSESKPLGEIIIKNIGDTNYSTGCVNNFSLSRVPGSFTSEYLLAFEDTLVPSGILFDAAYQKVITLGPQENQTVFLTAGFPAPKNPLREFPVVNVFSSINDSITGVSSQNLVLDLTVAAPGPYLTQSLGNEYLLNDSDMSIPTYAVILRNITIGTNIANLGGNNSLDSTAYNVTFGWDIPAALTAFITNPLNYTFNLSNNSPVDVSLNLSFNENNINLFPNDLLGVVTLRRYLYGYNQNDDLIIHANNQTYLNETWHIEFNCPTPDEIEEGITTATACVVDPTIIGGEVIGGGGTSGQGGSGGGGGLAPEQIQRLFQTEAYYELVRGQSESFMLEVENTFKGKMERVNATITGFLNQYLTIEPNSLQEIPVNKSINYTIQIAAPEYFTDGQYALNISITALINRSRIVENLTYFSYENINETRAITLLITSVSKADAENYLKKSKKILDEMQSKEYSIRALTKLLLQMNVAFSERSYADVKTLADRISLAKKQSDETIMMLTDLEQGIANAHENGLTVTETQRLLLLTKATFERGDYATSLQRANDAKITLALETVGKINLFVFAKNNWEKILALFLIMVLCAYIFYLIVKYVIISQRLRMLDQEKNIILQLIKEIQIECFKYNKISMEQYAESLVHYDEKISAVIKKIIELTTEKKFLFKLFTSQIIILKYEKDNLIKNIQETQDKYINSHELETRLYESRMKTYTERLAEIEEKLVTLEVAQTLKQAKISA